MGVSACFVSHGRSFLIRGYSCPLKPQQGIRFAHSFFKRGQPPLIVVLACGSLGLIGLSRFLQCSVSFFLLPTLLAVFAVFALVVPPDAHTAKHCLYPSKSRPASKITFHKLHSILSAGWHLLSPQKNYTTQQKTRQPCVFHVGSRSPHSATLHCGLSASATLAPLAVGSRLSTTQAKNHSAIAPLIFYPLRSGSRLFYLRCFCAAPAPTPDHPPLKQLNFLFYLRYHAVFLNCSILNFSSFCPKKRNMQS